MKRGKKERSHKTSLSIVNLLLFFTIFFIERMRNENERE